MSDKMADMVKQVGAQLSRTVASLWHVDGKVTGLKKTVEDIRAEIYSLKADLDSARQEYAQLLHDRIALLRSGPVLYSQGTISPGQDSMFLAFPANVSTVFVVLENVKVAMPHSRVHFNAYHMKTPDGSPVIFDNYGDYTQQNVPTNMFGSIKTTDEHSTYSVCVKITNITGPLQSECSVTDIGETPRFYEIQSGGRLTYRGPDLDGLKIQSDLIGNVFTGGRWAVYS